MLRRGGSSIAAEDSDSLLGEFLPAQIIIDYNRLCDDIYICDWI